MQRFGFTHGKILEPSMGTGHFFGLMPEVMRNQSALTSIEIDSLTEGLVRLLYPDANIRQQGSETASRARSTHLSAKLAPKKSRTGPIFG